MANAIRQMDKFHDTRRGKLVFATAELLIAFGFFVWAVDTGELWQYALTIIFFIGGARNLFGAVYANNHDRKKHR
jgi:hypothetical protein